MRMIVRGLRRIFSMVMSPCDSSLVRCTDRLLSERPGRACRYLKSALTRKSSASSSASRAGSWTMRSMPTMSLNGSDTRGDLVAAGDEEPVIADAHDRQHRGNREVEQGLVRLPGSHTEGAKQREGEQDRGRDQIVAAKRVAGDADAGQQHGDERRRDGDIDAPPQRDGERPAREDPKDREHL